MRCYFYIQKQLSNETQTIMLSEEGRGGGGVRKKKRGAKGIRSEASSDEKRGIIYTQKKISSLKFCWVTGRVKLQTGLSFLLLSLSSPTSGEPRHTACVPTPPPPSPPNTHLRTQHNPRERKSDGGRKTGWGILLTPQPSRGVGHAFVTRTHKKIKNKADRRKQEEKKKKSHAFI